MFRVWSLWDAASLTFVYFLSFFFKRSLQLWIVWILQKEKKDAEVQRGKRLGRKEYYLRTACSLQSSFLESVLILLALFQNEPCSLLSCLGLLLFSLPSRKFLIRTDLDSIFMFLANICWIAAMCLLRSSDGYWFVCWFLKLHTCFIAPILAI